MEKFEEPDTRKILIGTLIGTLGLAAIIYGGYNFSRNKGFKLTLPTGPGYTGLKSPSTDNPPTAPVRFTAAADTPWVSYSGKIYSYTFSYPGTLSLQVFGDPPDSIGISWGNLNPKLNILLDIQSVSDRANEYVGQTQEYARNWWKFYSGLKGVKSVDRFVNANGLVGYKAIYINQADQSPNVDVFFEVPKNPEIVIHLANGVLDPEIFNRIVDSVKYSPETPSPAPEEVSE